MKMKFLDNAWSLNFLLLTNLCNRLEEQRGPAHDKKFACSVRVVISNKEYIALGDFKSRVKDSENSAAAKMLYEISTF